MTPFGKAEWILRDGRIYSRQGETRPASALAIAQGRIAALGSSDELEALRGPGTQLMDLEGASVLPGLTDAHLHFEQYARSLTLIDCETESLRACLERVRRKAEGARTGEWLLGHGWNQTRWEGYGTASDLDSVAPGNPVYLTAKSLHAAWANSAALEAAGIRQQTPDPEGGAIQRDADGSPTGILFESAMQLVTSQIPALSLTLTVQTMKAAQEELWKAGLTGLHDFDGTTCFQALQILREQGELGLRIVKNLPVASLGSATELGLRSGFGDEWIRIGNVKVFADGALGPRTAAMLAPYEGEPDNFGILLVDREGLFETAARAAENGLGMTVHAIGDRANHEVIEAFAALREFEQAHGLPRRRHRIEHLQRLHPEDIERVPALGLVASMQPIHATSDMEMANRYWGDRIHTSYAWRRLQDHGAVLAFGSDAPVESPDPFKGIHAAVTRRREDGSPGPDGWIPEERISLRQAIAGYTEGPAYAARLEGVAGRLAPGYLADLIVLDRDPFDVSPEALADLRPVATMVGGVWRFRQLEG